MNNMNEKKLNGRFFTITNPFLHNAFFMWFESIPINKRKEIIEPFAGSNNIIAMISELGFDNIFDFQYHLLSLNNL